MHEGVYILGNISEATFSPPIHAAAASTSSLALDQHMMILMRVHQHLLTNHPSKKSRGQSSPCPNTKSRFYVVPEVSSATKQ